jgi:hypothetical protein
MTPKEKARLLIDRFNHFDESYYHESFKNTDLGKQCALIAVDEIIKSNPISFDKDDNCIASYWWVDVKKEIEQL